MSDHHVHGDLGEMEPGYDQDFPYPHLDDPRINDLDEPAPAALAASYDDMVAQFEEDQRDRDE